MSLTIEQFKEWLSASEAIKCTLVEVVANTGSIEETFYLSNRNYSTKTSEVPSNTIYLPVLQSSVSFTETITPNSTASLSYGDIAVNNPNGELDSWAGYVWVGRAINVYMGDVSFSRSDFTLIFSGIVEDIAFSGPDSINLSIRDKLQRLNTPITDTLLGSYGTKGIDNANKEQIRPLIFGEVHNISPLLVDDVLLDYMVHNGRIERIIEVRDNGVPVQHTPNLANGTFRLTYPPIGTITCSVQGDNYYVDNTGVTVSGYVNTIPKLIQRIITGYGNPLTAITSGETELTTFEDLSSSNTQPSGVYISDRANILEVCHSLAGSIGMQLIANRGGTISLVKLDVPVANSNIIDDNHIILDSLQISTKVPVMSSIKLGYCKNWTMQGGILTNIPEEHKDLFNQEYLVKLVTDSSVKAMYKQSAEPVQINTLLLTNAAGEVAAEANRLLLLYKTPRFIYKFTCTSKLIYLSLGDMITLYHYRFGLSNGKYGQVVSISIDWDTGTTTLEVLI